MFSGLVEAKSLVTQVFKQDQSSLRLTLGRPEFFGDLDIGHSVCVNGACLTVDSLGEKTMEFVLGPETLKVTGWDIPRLSGRSLNVERSLCLGDRIHGHMVTGHVDVVGQVLEVKSNGESKEVEILIPKTLGRVIYPKGSIAVNGVSLTVNAYQNSKARVCLIPKTLEKTNLGQLQKRDAVNLEGDYLAKLVWGLIKKSPNLTQKGEVYA